MKIVIEKEDNILLFSIAGRLDSTTSPDFEARLVEALEKGETRLIVDFRNLDYISSAGLRVILKVTKQIEKRGGKMALCSLKDYVREVFEISGFDTFLPIAADRKDAAGLLKAT